ncbi:NAD(P)H-binding protein [Nonomuraea sp. NPDC050536]|uniref:NmrA family NAD(P)-binding protein n=1 Tax=Nonomuraea sp. NPDC050536 TaxID=3364366 RepID=UPI0037CBE9BD
MKDILILGGTGKTGRRIVQRLHSAGLPVRTASRSSGFDLGDPDTWASAFDGVTAAYLVEPDLRAGVDRQARFPRLVTEAVGAGVRRLVLLSAHDVGKAGDDHPLKAAEQAVRDSGAAWTILRPTWFSQNFSEAFFLPGILHGTLALPTGDGRTPFVDAEDIAAVAASALTEERHDGQEYQLTGPRAISFGEAADLIGRATGRTIRHLDVDPDSYVERRVAEGVPRDVALLLTDLLVSVRDGGSAALSDGVERALSRPPRPFEEYVAEAAAAGSFSSAPAS